MDIGIFLAGIITVITIYGIMAMALNLSFGQTGIIDLGLMAWVAVGAYSYVLITVKPPSDLDWYVISLNLPIWVGVIGAFLVPAVLAFFVGFPTLRLGGEYLCIAAYAFSMVVASILTNEGWLSNGVRGFYGLEQPFRGMVSGSAYQYVLMVLVLAIAAVVFIILRRVSLAPFGRTLKAIRESEEVALSIGKNLFKYKMYAYVFSAGIFGLAGALYVWYSTVLVPEMFTETMTFTVFIALVIGGKGNFRGVLLGTAVLLGAQEITRFFQASADLATVLAAIRFIAMGLLMVLVIRFKRRGMLPEQKVQM